MLKWELDLKLARLERELREEGCPDLPTAAPKVAVQDKPDPQKFSALSDAPDAAWWMKVGSVMALGELVPAIASRVWQAKSAVMGLAGSFFVSAGYFDQLQKMDAERGSVF